MLLKRYSVYKQWNSEFYISDNLREVFIEYGYETLESALRECDEWNSKDKTLEKEAIFASKKELSDILEITITLVDGSELFFELDKNGKCLSDFFKISAGCSIDDVKFEKGIIKEVSFSETWEWRRELCVKSRKSEKSPEKFSCET